MLKDKATHKIQCDTWMSGRIGERGGRGKLILTSKQANITIAGTESE